MTISSVKYARDTVTRDEDPAAIVQLIKSDLNLKRSTMRIRRLWAEAGGHDNLKAAKKAVEADKLTLPAAMWSGRFKDRDASSGPVEGKLIAHSGLLCADLDGLNGQIDDVKLKLQKSESLWCVFTSPSGDGLKAIFRVPASKEKHRASFLAVKKHVLELTGEQIDEACKDTPRLCFLAFDPDSYFNQNAKELAPEAEPPKKKTAAVIVGSAELEKRKQIATELLGEIDWQTEATGLCTCPGKLRHTAGDNDRDCKIYLETFPAIHCFHSSCHEIVELVERELRSRIWRAERPAAVLGNSISSDRAEQTEDQLPSMEDAAELISKPIDLPDDVIEGVLHRGGKMVVGGGSKSFKTWTLADLGISVATGTDWLGKFATKRGRVLYINLELQRGFFSKRIRWVCDERQITLEDGWLTLWNLRGKAADLSRLLPKILSGIGENQFDLIIIDPIYKLLGSRDENKAGDIATLLNEIESLAVQTGAAVAFGAHYSKGNQAQKEVIDRIGGSGVFARDPDTILNFTRHEQEDCFSVEATLRNHPPIKSFVVRWEFPLMVVDSLLDPADLKQAGPAKDKPEPKTKEDMLALVPEDGSIAFNVLIRLGQDANIGVNKGRSFITELIDDGVLFRWLVSRPRTNDEVRISRHKQNEKEEAK